MKDTVTKEPAEYPAFETTPVGVLGTEDEENVVLALDSSDQAILLSAATVHV